MASKITAPPPPIVYSTVYSGVDQRKHQSSASLAFVPGIHRRPVNSPHKWPVTRKILSLDDVIMEMPFLEILSRNDRMILKVKVNDPIFNTSWENHKMHIWCEFGESSSNWLQIIVQKKFLESYDKIFNTSREYLKMYLWCKCNYSVPNLWRVIVRQFKFPRILSEIAKLTLKVKINDPYLQYQLKLSHDTCLVQIWCFKLKSMASYRADKVKFADRRTDGQTHECRQYSYSL